MNKKQFALSAAAFIVALALVSCEPLRGHAVEISYEEQAGINDYLSAGNTALFTIDFRLDEDTDGNRSKRLQIYGLQSAMLNSQTQIYDSMDFSVAPSSVSVSGSGASGVFYDNQHALHGGTVLQGSSMSGTLFISDLFTITYGFYSNQTDLFDSSLYTCSPYSYSSGASGDTGVQCVPNDPHSSFYPYRRTFATSSYLTTLSGSFYNGNVSSATVAVPRYLDNSYPPTILPNTNVCGICAGSVYGGSSGYTKLLGYSVNVTLPTATTDTKTPWDYYNNTLIPYMIEQFPDVTNIEQYFIFPGGYEVPDQPTTVPVEYPTLPGFDYALETNGTEPASDYNYNIPDLPGKDVAVPQFDFTQINPAEVMAPVAQGLRGIWQLISMVLTEYGLFPYVGLAVFSAIVLMLLHLGK